MNTNQLLPLWLGADPGISGAIAFVGKNGFVRAYPLRGLDEREIFDLIYGLRSEFDIQHALIEAVHALPAAVTRKLEEKLGIQRGSIATAKLLQSYGTLRTAISGNGIPLEKIDPRKWQGLVGCLVPRSQFVSYSQKKAITRQKAQELFPGYKVTHAVADALLLAYLCRITAPMPGLLAETR